MQRNRIAWRNVLRQRRISGDQFGSSDEVQGGRCQRWHVQRLADVADRVRSACVLVEQAAGGEVQEYHACQNRQHAPHKHIARLNPPRAHYDDTLTEQLRRVNILFGYEELTKQQAV
jgi:hypothetical protein